MSAIDKILEVQSILIEQLGSDITSFTLNKSGKELKFILISGIVLYIVYNDYDQYSYSIIYTQSKYDRIRYDNFDDRWDVVTRPHHLHIRGSNKTEQSEMTGLPNSDMLTFLEILNEK
ncbi:MAG: hypothetical protein HeimC2_39410 [Candidatus Heimdallarchaeota archaeon LC_2]|nr:MAG: hypothetical protein HeimC2_39410 [Candidatus Heimdallarchaeota archaeon LC_2]